MILWVFALILGLVTLWQGEHRPQKAFKFTFEQAIVLFPRLLVAPLSAVFLAVLIPGEFIASLVGADSGMKGILIAALAGALIPGGPVMVYPLALVLLSSGAGVPQVISFLTAWSIFAPHRIMMYELTFVGWRFSVFRLMICLPLPMFAGWFAQTLLDFSLL